jgi:BirA family biotin operon repressor/biotin-[acetyl-CoA-carboxylase] ligase
MPKIHFFKTIASTQDYAKALAGQGAASGTVVYAQTQSAGRGTGAHFWHSPAGGLWFSLLLRPELSSAQIAGLNWIIALAIIRVLRAQCGAEAQFHLPNDIFLEGKKLGGVLCESRLCSPDKLEYLVIGVGLNINTKLEDFPAELKDRIITWQSPLKRETLLNFMVNSISEVVSLYCKSKLASFLPELESICYTLGKIITIDGTLRGKVIALTPKGSFILDSGEEIFAAQNIMVFEKE